MRNNKWLAIHLADLHHTYFSDVLLLNQILVRFGRKSRTRFGSIIAKIDPKTGETISHITINGLFKDETVPEYVILATLAHEFVHYAHGFHSPHPQIYPHPHRGDIVNKELRKRGVGHLLDAQNVWIKEDYRAFLRLHKLI